MKKDMTCPECGAPSITGKQCLDCWRKKEFQKNDNKLSDGKALEKKEFQKNENKLSDGKASEKAERGSLVGCVLMGIIFSAIGWIFLLNPTASGTEIVNIQKLIIGATSALIGAIFMAAALRPRAK